MSSSSPKKPEKVKVKFRDQPKSSNIPAGLNKALKTIETGQKIKDFFARSKIQKWANIIVAAVAPILVLNLFVPLGAKVIAAFGTNLAIPTGLIKNIIFYTMPIVAFYSIKILIKLYRWPQAEILKLKKPSKKGILIIILSLLAYIICSGAVVLIASSLKLIPENLLTQTQDIGFSTSQSALGLINVFIILAIIAPLVEEMIFRGMGYLNLRRLLGFWPAAIYTSLIFALYHGQLNVGIDTFILGMFMALAVEKTDSLWASPAMHVIKNGIAFSYLFLIK